MWPFSKKYTIRESGIFNGLTDWHCHLLPGVDDGVKKLDDTLQLLALYEELGISELWFTPHIMEDIPNTTEGLRKVFETVKAAYKGPVKLNLAAEYMLDNLFDERFDARDLLYLGPDSDHLLVETSYFNPPMDLRGKLDRIRAAGINPVLAHPERYVYMDDDDYSKYQDMGVKFQLNLPSLAGLYGEDVREKAVKLLERGYYSRVGTDTHRMRGLSLTAEHGRLRTKQRAALIASATNPM